MPISILSASDAIQNAASNPFASYPDPGSDGDRLYPVATPAINPGFAFPPDPKIFTMGSCFARNVERALVAIGLNVVSRNQGLPEKFRRRDGDDSLFNKYSVHSILNELRWALDPETPYPGKDALIEKLPGRWRDLQLGPGINAFPLEDMLELRRDYLATMARAREADVLIITLGLAESWYDRELGLYVNQFPGNGVIRKNEGRFEMHVLGYADILDCLEQIRDLVMRHCKPGLRMLLTVSPVPLKSTFRDRDVLVANAYSKAVQRAAAEEFTTRHPDVDYFPSYEYVTLSNPEHAWGRTDYRHVSSVMVDRIMAAVVEKYAGAG